MDYLVFLYRFSSVSARINFIFTLVLFLFFQQAKPSYSTVYLGVYGLMCNDHINVGLMILQLIAVGLNWASGLWLNTLLAGILSIEFSVYFVVAVLYGKTTTSQVVLSNAFDSSCQFLLYVILFIFDCVYFNENKSAILLLVAFLLPRYSDTRVVILVLFIVEFILYLNADEYYRDRESRSPLITIMFILSFTILIDLALKFR